MGFGGSPPAQNIGWTIPGWGTIQIPMPGMGGGSGYPVANVPAPQPGGGSVVTYLLETASRAVGRRLTLASFLSLAKKMIRFMGPTAVAAFFLLQEAEFATLLGAASVRKRRRMNSLNPRALNRAMRRVCSFKNRVERANYVVKAVRPRRRSKSCR